LISDLHLEFRIKEWYGILDVIQEAWDTHKPDFILDAGDLHPHEEIRSWWHKEMADKGIHYLSVMGNHDFYDHGLIKPSRIYDKEFGVVGTSLWTNFDNADPFTMSKFRDTMADGTQIRSNGGLLVDELLEIHRGDLNFISEHKDASVVMTHHAPSLKSVHKKYRKTGFVNYYFASDLDQFILDHPHIKLWVHGHMHDPVDYMIGDCRVVANPLGYPSERRRIEWNPLLIEV
jgi:predicted phosphodiesterase